MLERPPAPPHKPIKSIPVTPPMVNEFAWGPLNSVLLCSYCGKVGGVHTKQVTRKKGVSGGKATAAVLTAGLSVLATGLSRKELETCAHCAYCRSTWCF